jgi:DNA-binding NarL/FixJ family response regulator
VGFADTVTDPDGPTPGGAATRIRIVVVDDHPVFRDGTAAILEREPDLAVVGVAADLEAARELLARDPPDVVLLDIRLGDESGLAVVEELAARAAVVIFTAYDYPQYLHSALRLGAAGFVGKSAPTEELLRAVRLAAAGGMAFDRRRLGSEPMDLTGREIQIVRLLADGASNDEIGLALGITTKSVESALGRIFTRTSTRSRTELAVRAVQEGWLDVPLRGSAGT